MELIVDIGNSNIVIGLWKNNKWSTTWRLQTIKGDQARLYYKKQLDYLFIENGIVPNDFEKVMISSVVPQLNETVDQLLRVTGFSKIQWINADILSNLDIQIDNPKEIGTDLVANAVGAFRRFNQACIVIDFGTALTFTTINKCGSILGVSIAPGLKTAIDALFGKTAQLPVVPLELPKSAIGKNTEHAIQSGVLIGYVGLVKNVVTEISKELTTRPLVIATGGLSSILSPLQEIIDHHIPTLTLDGIREIFCDV